MADLFQRRARPLKISKHLRRAFALRRSTRNIFATCCLIVVVLVAIARVLVTRTLLPSNRRAKLAFFVQVSDTSVLHVPRLLRAIWHRENVYVIHFDAKIDHERRIRMARLLKKEKGAKHGNILAMNSEPVSYAGVSMLVNTINAISLVLRTSQNWDYFINLSGQDYPLVSASNMRQLLGMSPVFERQLNFLQTQDSNKDLAWFFTRRIRRMHVDTALWYATGENATIRGKLIEVNATHPVTNGRIVKTEGWVILHRSFCKYAVESAPARRLLLSFATARAADELFFGTLLTGSGEFSDKVVWDGLRFVLWGINGEKWSRPAFLDEMDGADVRNKVAKSGALFARKFRKTESELMRFLDANIIGIAERNREIDEHSVEQYMLKAKSRLFCDAMKNGEEIDYTRGTSVVTEGIQTLRDE